MVVTVVPFVGQKQLYMTHRSPRYKIIRISVRSIINVDWQVFEPSARCRLAARCIFFVSSAVIEVDRVILTFHLTAADESAIGEPLWGTQASPVQANARRASYVTRNS
jgi:hypothetical protein